MTVAEVLAEHPGWLAVDKPVGAVVVPARAGDPEDCLWRRLQAGRGETLWVVHRLDRDTSGVVVFARDAAAHRHLSLAFEQGRVEKEYLAFTLGVPWSDDVRVPLRTDGRRTRPAEAGGGKPSRTRVEVLRRWQTALGPVALVKARPMTGRQHQIRVHLRAVGAPLLVDALYGEASSRTWEELGLPGAGVALARHPLHASRLALPSPEGAWTEEVTSPLPADLLALQRALEATGTGSRA